MKILRLLAVGSCLLSFAFAQELSSRAPEIKPAPGKAANTEATYQQLKAIALTGDAVDVTNLVIKRDIATITLESGTVQFTPAINGMVTGAAFMGKGKITIHPAVPTEQVMLSKLSKGAYEETFTSMVFRFTDSTYQDVKSATGSVLSATPKGTNQFDAIKQTMRDTLHYNLNGRILNDVLVGKGGMFWAFWDGANYGQRQAFEVDPHGVTTFNDDGVYYEMSVSDFTPSRFGSEEVTFFTYPPERDMIYVAEHFLSEIQSGKYLAGNGFEIEHQTLDTQIDKNGHLNGDAQPTIVAKDDTRVAAFNLFNKLHVSSVTFEDGTPLDFIQEPEKADWGFYVILPANKAPGQKATFRIQYAGKDAVSNEGGGNYFPIARDNWYPTIGFGHYSTYDMTFRIPKKHNMAATGALVRQADEGDWNISTWKADVPQATAGFNFGRFKSQEVKLDKEGVMVTGYANQDQPDVVKDLQHNMQGYLEGATLGTMSTIPMLNRNVAEAQIAVQIYTNAFGPMPYKNLAVTQQTACTFGQAWPGLVYLPICAFFDTTTRHQLGFSDDRGYWQVVGPHEVAHQWWGHLVGFDGLRDQWMSEGFAEFSASIFVQQVYAKDPGKFMKFWKDELELMTEKNKEGRRAIDVGPLVEGYRLATKKTGENVPRYLIYPKGAYVLHMLRMMMADRQTGDQRFNAMMRDFATTYANRTATTEDFKAMVEKHMLPTMNFTRDGKMDWFFNEYIYGTALPSYHFEASFGEPNGGKVRMHVKLTQSGVSDDFKMTVPIYLELQNGAVARLGLLGMEGSKTFEQDLDLPLQQKPKRAMINYYYDVLSLNN